MKTAFMTALVAFAAAPVAANADAEQLYFDPNHTQISVDWAHAAGAPLTFYFTDWDAELMYDAENIENSSVNVTLPLTGLWTGIDGFTDHLQSDDFFTAETWPSASFTSTSVTRTGDDTAELTGDLTIKDKTAPVTFDVKLLDTFGDGDNARTGFKAWTTLSRSEWGLGYGENYAADDVKVIISTELVKDDPDAEEE